MGKIKSQLWEILRKLVHLLGLGTVIVYYAIAHYTSEKIALLSLVFGLLILLVLEFVRMERLSKIATFFDGVFRRHERNNLTGAVFYLISAIICLAIFDFKIAVVAMIMMAFGDIFSCLMGKAFGKTHLFRNKTVVGTLSGFAANVISGMIFLPNYPLIIFVMAFVATVVELFSGKLDDNLTVPLFSGFVGQVLVYFLGISW